MSIADQLEALILDEARFRPEPRDAEGKLDPIGVIDRMPGPIQKDDVIRVFHGFRSFADAVDAAKRGMSGKDQPNRVYSYEVNNNPRGIFVTIDRKTAQEFTGAIGIAVVIEFNARYSELESPVWPGGGYTVQGQASQSFRSAYDRHQATKAARKAAEKSHHEKIAQSHRPEVAHMIFSTREHQALFVGHLNPNRIKRVWVSEPDERGHQSYNAKFVPMARSKFLKRYASKVDPKSSRAVDTRHRKLRPMEPFTPEGLIAAFQKKYPSMSREELMDVIRSSAFPGGRFDKRAALRFADQYLWPKQYPQFLRWASRL